LEDSEDCRSAGGHGNQHVRLRSSQIDGTETICPALAALLLRAAADVRFFVRFEISSGSRFQAINEFLKLRCIERPVESANAVRFSAPEALPFNFPSNLHLLPRRISVAVDRNLGITRSDSLAAGPGIMVGCGVGQ
jgi:hypothetical protein